MARSACDVAHRTRRSQLFHDRLLESRQFDSPGTDARHTRKRTAHADQPTDRDRRQFSVGLSRNDVLLVFISLLWSRLFRLLEARQFDSPGTDARHTRKRTAHADQPTDRDRRQFSVGLSRNDVLLVFISLLWSRLFRRRVSRQFLSRSRFSVTHDLRARLSRHSLSEFRDGLQTWRSVRHLSRRRLGAFLRSLLPNAITKTIRRTKTRQHLAPTSCNLRSRRHSSGLDRRPRPHGSQRAAHYTALFSRGVASLFALGFRTCSQTRQTRGQSDSVLTRASCAFLWLSLTTRQHASYHRAKWRSASQKAFSTL